jgi:hypothetical protein
LFSLKESVVRLFAALSCTRSKYGPVTDAGTLNEFA